ncbi:MAG: acyltransferase [Dorea sp.]|nr:acyltransferase [Dorea sp.]
MKMKSHNSETQNGYIKGIDGLRAAAVLMVSAYHLKLPFAKCGLLGVTVFFVISGFLITRILISEIENTSTVNLKNFWIRRVRRLLPAVLTMAAALIFATAACNRVLFTKACQDLTSAVFCYNNWHQIYNQVSYFENAGAPSPLTHCWSLAIEAQFYLVYPLILLVLARFRNRKRLSAGVTAALALISLGLMWMLFNPAEDPSRVYYGTDTRAFSLLFGSCLAMAEEYAGIGKRIPGILRDIAGVAAFIGLIFMMVRIDGYSSFLYRGGQGLASLLAVLVILALLNEDSVLNKVLGLYPLRWIGERSYGIYLWHYPIILLTSGVKKPVWWMILIDVLLTGILSGLSYYFIETPVRRGAIGRNIEIMKSHPETRRERRKHQRIVQRNIRVGAGVLAVGIGVALCAAFVPRDTALDHIDAMEKHAEDVDKLTSQKAAEQKDKKGSGSEDDAQGGRKAMSEEELLASLNLLLIGDSIALDVTEYYYETFPNSISDTAIGRYTMEGIEIYDSYVQENGWDGDGVIFALGSNGPLYEALPALRERMGPDKALFVVTAKAPGTEWEASNNEEICAFAETTENTYLIDWYQASGEHDEWFDEDDTHLLPEGAKAYRECIKEAVLKVFKN